MDKTVKKVDVVFDVYKEMSLKQETREGRNLKFSAFFSIQHLKFQNLLRVSENKIELIDCRLCCRTMYRVSYNCRKR